jgi:putative intracellular protease/amidase
MELASLAGKKIAILVESQYFAPEIKYYLQEFSALGAEVQLMSRLWGNPQLTFVSEVETPNTIPETLDVHIDFSTINMNDYAAIIMAANYTSVRLRWVADEDLKGGALDGSSARLAPAVQFFYNAMMNPKIIKGFPCHGLWILTPCPELLAGRTVTCNRVMLGDVRNAGGVYVSSTTGVVADADMVTSDSSSHEETLREFVNVVQSQIVAMERGEIIPATTASTTPSITPLAETPLVHKKKRKILMLVSEWGYWGEELIGPLEEFDKAGYQTDFITPTGKRPNAILVSKQTQYIDPPLGRSVTTAEMAAKTTAIDDAATEQGRRLNNPRSLKDLFPERPYWADPQMVRLMEIYFLKLETAHKQISDYDSLIIVGGSGPIVDLANNQRVHDLILTFYDAGKPIAAECYGVTCLAFARNINDRKSIIWGKRVTGHCLEYDYKDGTGFMKAKDTFLDFNMGPPPYPLEYILRDATGPDGAYVGNFGHPQSVIVDYPFITGRSTPDSYLTGRKLIEVLDGDPGLRKWGW